MRNEGRIPNYFFPKSLAHQNLLTSPFLSTDGKFFDFGLEPSPCASVTLFIKVGTTKVKQVCGAR